MKVAFVSVPSNLTIVENSALRKTAGFPTVVRISAPLGTARHTPPHLRRGAVSATPRSAPKAPFDEGAVSLKAD